LPLRVLQDAAMAAVAAAADQCSKGARAREQLLRECGGAPKLLEMALHMFLRTSAS